MSGGPYTHQDAQAAGVEDDHCIAMLPMRTIGGAEAVKVVETG